MVERGWNGNEEELRRLAASLVVFGFDRSGEEASDHAKRMIRRGCTCAILFGRNVSSPKQVKKLCTSLKLESEPHKLLIMTDQEGGRVARLSVKENFTEIPSARTVASCSDDVNAVSTVAKVMASELKAVHIDMDLAPVVDVDSNPRNPVIGDRSYSSDSEKVGKLGSAFIEAMQAEGVATCAKHFPGHGDTLQDSHKVLPVIKHKRSRLMSVEIPPFRDAIKSGVASIIVGHLLVPALQDASEIKRNSPASMSKSVVDLLRRGLGYEGVVLVDDMEMGAIADVEEAAVCSINAGVDLLLVCHSENKQIASIEAIVRGVKQGIIPFDRVQEAAARVQHLVETYASVIRRDNTLKIVGSLEHRNIIKSILKNM